MGVLKLLKKRWYLPLIILSIGGLFILSRPTSKAQNKEQKSYVVQKETFTDTLSLSGQIDATEKANLTFQSAGKLTWVGVKEGDSVKKYQTIASLDQRDIKARLQKYLNTYLTTRSQFDQKQDDNKDSTLWGLTDAARAAAIRLGDQSQYALDNSVLDVQLQNLALEYANISSPIAGVVTHITTPVAGVNVTPLTAEFDIVNPSTLYFSALADQTEVVKLSKGEHATVILDAYPDASNGVSVQDISFTPKEGETGTVYEVKLVFDDASLLSQYRMGMTGDVNFDLSSRPNVLAVPKEFIKSEGDKKYVLKKIGSTQEKVYVTVGDVQDTLTEITSGLSAGDIVYD